MVRHQIKRTSKFSSEVAKYSRLAGYGVSIGYRGDDSHIGIDGRANISNTELSYIQEVGDPAINLPPRPFILQSLRAVNAFKRIGDFVRKFPTATATDLQPLINKIVDECKTYVKEGGVTPELEDTTILRRQSKSKKYDVPLASVDYPIYETGELIDALSGWISKLRR